MFSGVHLHLLVNHAPLFGALFALALLAASFLWASEVLRRTALVVLVFTAIAGLVSDLTGEPAEDAIRGFPGVRREVIHEHEELAEKSLVVANVIGVFALGALVRWRGTADPAGRGARRARRRGGGERDDGVHCAARRPRPSYRGPSRRHGCGRDDDRAAPPPTRRAAARAVRRLS